MGFVYSPSSGGVNTLSVPGGYTVMEDSGIVEANPETGPMATVKYKVLNQADRYSFVQQLLGQWTGSPPSNFFYVGPFEYPPSPNLLCTAVPSIEPFGKPTPLSVGLPYLFKQSAIVTAVFTRPPWQPLTSGGYFSIDFNASGEFLNLPQTVYQFSDGTPTAEPIGILIPQAQIVVKRFRMPFLPDSICMPLLGTLNNAPFTIGWNTYATGTLMFAGMNSETTADPLGNITYNCGYIFQFRPIDWNYYPYPGRNFSFQVVTDGNSNPVYNYSNFNAIP